VLDGSETPPVQPTDDQLRHFLNGHPPRDEAAFVGHWVETNEFAEAIPWYEKGLAVAKAFDKPEVFEKGVAVLKNRIAACTAA
jgi:hypothetical protein